MLTLLAPLFVLTLFVLVFAGDLCITALKGHDTVRAILYGIVAVLALLSLFVTLGVIH
jgi:archaellum biogenesis protein FlaJ (TadC family)